MGATNDLTTSTFGVSGLTCAHCVASVTDEAGYELVAGPR